QAEDGIRAFHVTGVQTCALPILDGVVLAAAGVRRLGRIDEATDVLDSDVMLPPPGQGALAVECRADDAHLSADDASLRDALVGRSEERRVGKEEDVRNASCQ